MTINEIWFLCNLEFLVIRLRYAFNKWRLLFGHSVFYFLPDRNLWSNVQHLLLKNYWDSRIVCCNRAFQKHLEAWHLPLPSCWLRISYLTFLSLPFLIDTMTWNMFFFFFYSLWNPFIGISEMFEWLLWSLSLCTTWLLQRAIWIVWALNHTPLRCWFHRVGTKHKFLCWFRHCPVGQSMEDFAHSK